MDHSIALTSDTSGDRTYQMEAAKSEHNNSFASTRCLHPELLSEIFLYCPKELPFPRLGTLQHYSDILSLKEGPLRLTHVCQTWRAIAISTPRLWNSLKVLLKKPMSESRLAQFQTWLARSRASPLTLLVIEIGLSRDDEVALTIFRLLAEQSYRWEDVSLILPYDTLMIFAAINHHGLILPQIRSFSVALGADDIDTSVIQLGPRLHTFCCRGSHMYALTPSKIKSLSAGAQMKLIEINRPGVSVSECLEILRIWPDLETLIINCSKYSVETMAHHTRLRSLTIISSNAQIHQALLDTLDLPYLQEFGWEIDSRSNQSIPAQSTESFLARSPSIKYLRIRWHLFVATENDLVASFRLMPALTHLVILAEKPRSSVSNYHSGNLTYDYSILRQLCFSGGTDEHELLPRLQSIKLDGTMFNFNPEDIMAFLQSRRRHGGDGVRSRIRSATIRCHRPFSMQDMSELDLLQQEGLHFKKF